MITANQLLVHLIGDYIIQSDWMAQNKTKSHFPAAVHAITYSLPFLLFKPSLLSFLVILVTHFFIDRYRLARYVCWLKNSIGGSYRPWRDCSATGYAPEAPPWLSVWLMIVADNILHLVINGAALTYL